MKLAPPSFRAIKECKVRRAAALTGALNPNVLRDYLGRLTVRERSDLLSLCALANGNYEQFAALGRKGGGDSEPEIADLALQVRLNSHALVEAYRRIQVS